MKDIEDIEDWIKQNNPYQDFEDFNMLLLKGYWSAGATAMAEYLKNAYPNKQITIDIIEGVLDYVQRMGIENSSAGQIYESLFSKTEER